MRELYRRYAKNLYRFGLQMLGDGGLAEEMVQESFQRLWRSAGRFDARRGSVGAFLFVIARSAAADIRKRPSSRLLLPVEDFQLPPLPDSTDQILDSLILREAPGLLTWSEIWCDVDNSKRFRSSCNRHVSQGHRLKGVAALHNFLASIFTAPGVTIWRDMSGNTRKNQVTRLVTLRHQSLCQEP